MQKIIIILSILGFLVIVATILRPPTAQVLHARLGGEVLVLEVVDTDALRTKGLSGHKELHEGEGMLFIFPKDDYHRFWMKDMRFSIDIMWIDSGYRIVDVKKDATPASYPEIFIPILPTRYVVEVPTGFFDKHTLKVGDTLEIL